MKTNNFKNYKNSFNAFNPFYNTQKISSKKINENSSRRTIESQMSSKRYKNILSRKQVINFNSSQIVKSKKILKNTDNNNDINNNATNKSNYYTNKTNKVKKFMNVKTSQFSQSRNFNKLNSNSLSNTIMSSFSFTNDITNYNNPNKKKDYDLDKLKESGIKYCFDEEGNPMDIIDIKIKNKNPIAFIIQTAKKNILMDTNDKIISPNSNGDYTLSHIPYIIIHKYDVLHPELRVIKNSDEDNGHNNIIGFKSLQGIKNDKSNNYYDTCVNLNGLDEISENIEKNNDTFKFFSPIIEPKINSYKNLNNNIRSQKRKYIFVNRLNDFNKSLQLKLNCKEDDKNISLIKMNFKNNDSTLNGNNFEKKYFSTINNDDKNNTSFFINNNINKLISKSNNNNKLSNIKVNLEENKVNKNLEFKFERQYKSINPLINKDENINIKDNEETPNKIKEIQLLNYFNSIPNNSNIRRTKKILLFNQNKNNKFDFNKIKRQKRESYSFNEYMFNPLLNTKQRAPRIINKDFTNWNSLSTFNQSLFSPTTEKTTFSTIQKNNQDSENNISLKNPKFKNSLKSKYYLKPKIKSVKFNHKRMNTEYFNNTKNMKFLQMIENEDNKVNSNYVTPFTLTENDFKTNKNIHDNKCDNNVCKCPYCHNLFYN